MTRTIPQTMQAARYHGPGPALQVETVPVPTVGGRGGPDTHHACGGVSHGAAFPEWSAQPWYCSLTLGHEIVGEVVLAGAGVGTAQPGDRVIVNYYGTCGQCVWCRTGQQNPCSHVVAQLGFTADGGYAEFAKARADMLVPLPAHLDAAEACTLGCSATRRCTPRAISRPCSWVIRS